MPAFEVRPFERTDVPAAAALLAARQRRDRARLPMLAAALEDPAACEPIVARLASGGRREGAAALRGGELAGFLFAEKMLLAPDHFASQFIPPHSVSIPVEGHAVAAGTDAVAAYREMYALLARGWVRDGFFVHRSHIVPGDGALEEAWVALGFGRHTTCGTRTTSPVARPFSAKLEVHRAGSEDQAVVEALNHTLYVHHQEAPIFWPFLSTTDEAWREFTAAALAAGEPPYFVGYHDGVPVGMQTFLRPGFTPPIVEREKDVYLFEGVVEAEERGGGAGTAILEHSMAWARSAGYESCTLHFASGNPSGAPFWLGHGFVPVEYTMERRIDERVAWARR